jgi:Tol biopolymer transport system component
MLAGRNIKPLIVIGLVLLLAVGIVIFDNDLRGGTSPWTTTPAQSEAQNTPAKLAPSPENQSSDLIVSLKGKLVFSSNRNGKFYQIFSMNADGRGLTQLTTSDLDHRLPRWSPDGTRIVFCWIQGHANNIFTTDTRGDHLTQLTELYASSLYPAWSPDGTRIAFTREVSGIDQIWVMNADGSNESQITEGSVQYREPVWSPDGTRIAFSSYRLGDYGIYVMQADGTNLIRLAQSSANTLAEPQWSPDGKRIVYTEGGGCLRLMDADGSNPIFIPKSPISAWNPVWSPDGTKIAFTSNKDQPGGIYILELKTGTVIRVSDYFALGSDIEPSWTAER